MLPVECETQPDWTSTVVDDEEGQRGETAVEVEEKGTVQGKTTLANYRVAATLEKLRVDCRPALSFSLRDTREEQLEAYLPSMLIT